VITFLHIRHNSPQREQNILHSRLSESGNSHLLLQESLDILRLASPNQFQIPASLQRLQPDGETQAKGEGGAEDDQPSLGAEPAPVEWEEQCWKGEEEGDEDEDGVHDAGCNAVSVLLE
jgi:hypothetical protein